MPLSRLAPPALPTPQELQLEGKRAQRWLSNFTPLGESLGSFFPKVVHLLTLPKIRPPPDPLPVWYRAHLFCSFHRALGHSTGHCHTLWDVVQRLVNRGILRVGVQEADSTPPSAPTHFGLPTHPLLRFASFEDARSSGASRSAPDFNSPPMDPSSLIGFALAPFAVPYPKPPVFLGQSEWPCQGRGARGQRRQGSASGAGEGPAPPSRGC